MADAWGGSWGSSWGFSWDGGGGITPNPPSQTGAVAYLDFVNAAYTIDGLPVAIGDILGSGFVPSDITSDGMAVWHTNSNRPDAIGALFNLIRDRMSLGMTVAFEINWDSGAAGAMLSISTPPDFLTANFFFESYLGDDADDHLTMLDLGGATSGDVDISETAAFAPGFNTTGVNLVAMTLSRDLGGGQYR